MEPLKEGIARAAHPGWENMTGPTHIGDVARGCGVWGGRKILDTFFFPSRKFIFRCHPP